MRAGSVQRSRRPDADRLGHDFCISSLEIERHMWELLRLVRSCDVQRRPLPGSHCTSGVSLGPLEGT